MACFDQDTRYGKGIILHVSLYLKEKKKYRRKVLKTSNNMLHMGKEAKKQLKPLIYKDFEKLKKKRNGLCAKIAKKTVQNRKNGTIREGKNWKRLHENEAKLHQQKNLVTITMVTVPKNV